MKGLPSILRHEPWTLWTMIRQTVGAVANSRLHILHPFAHINMSD